MVGEEAPQPGWSQVATTLPSALGSARLDPIVAPLTGGLFSPDSRPTAPASASSNYRSKALACLSVVGEHIDLAAGAIAMLEQGRN